MSISPFALLLIFFVSLVVASPWPCVTDARPPASGSPVPRKRYKILVERPSLSSAARGQSFTDERRRSSVSEVIRGGPEMFHPPCELGREEERWKISKRPVQKDIGIIWGGRCYCTVSGAQCGRREVRRARVVDICIVSRGFRLRSSVRLPGEIWAVKEGRLGTWFERSVGIVLVDGD